MTSTFFRQALVTLCRQKTSIQGLLASADHGPLLPSTVSALLVRNKASSTKMKKAANIPGLIYWHPTTPGTRNRISIDYKALGVYTGEPQKELSLKVNKTGGRCVKTGRITCRGRGGGIPKVLRWVDWQRSTHDVPGVVERVEFDPNRSGFLALVKFAPRRQLPYYRYLLAPDGIKPGDTMTTGTNLPHNTGNTVPLGDVAMNVPIHNIEMYPGGGGKMVRAAGTYAVAVSTQDNLVLVKLPSGERRFFDKTCMVTIGRVSNLVKKFEILGKAGVRRNRGFRPKVRGRAKNPPDHPHGGRKSGGIARVSSSPWAWTCKGKKTVNRDKWSQWLIHTERWVAKGGQTTKTGRKEKRDVKKAATA